MAAWLERFGLFARTPDARPASEIAAEIDAEIAFHLEQGARSLEDQGFTPDAARSAAEARFGDVQRVRRACVLVQLGERIMLQRIQVVLTASLLVAVVFLAVAALRSQREVSAQRDLSEVLLARLASLQPAGALNGVTAEGAHAAVADGALPPGEYVLPDGRKSTREVAQSSWGERFHSDYKSWRHGLAVAEQLASLTGSQGVEILIDLLPELSTAHREQVAKPFVQEGGHPNALELLAELAGSREPETSVRGRAFLDLHTYAWQDLWSGDGTLDEWMARWRDKPVAEVLRANAERWAGPLGDVLASYDQPLRQITEAFEVIDHIRPETYAHNGIDLGQLLTERIAVDRLETVGSGCDALTRQRVERVVGWCREQKPR